MSNPCNLIIIVAMARNRVIGCGNKLPWHLPGDLKRFKALTMGHTIVMGRKTYESLPNGALPGRRNVVLSRSALIRPKDVLVLSTISEVLELAKRDTLFIIGGGDVYRQFLPFACRIELTLIDADYEGDTYFPEIDSRQWSVQAEESFTDRSANVSGWFRTLERIQE